jgi:hypothetical protein
MSQFTITAGDEFTGVMSVATGPEAIQIGFDILHALLPGDPEHTARIEKLKRIGVNISPATPAPAGWLHTLDNTDGFPENKPLRKLSFYPQNPFGEPGKNYDEKYPVTSEPVFTHPAPVPTPNDFEQRAADVRDSGAMPQAVYEEFRRVWEAIKHD